MTEAAYNRLVIKNREHKIFNSDWEIYYSIDFADTLLPDIPLYKSKSLWMYDGAELFAGSQKTESRVLDLDNSGTLINLIAYIYPKDVKAAERKQFVQAAKSEVCLFAEVAQDDSIELSFKFGKRFKDYLKNLAANGVKAPTPTDVESKTYLTTIADFKAFFDNQLVHEDLMRFVLETVGLEMDFESNLRSKLVLFFRSEMQAKGLPKGNTSKPIIDDEYDGSFGFDIFSPKLYGYNTAVYKAERDSTGNEKMIESGKTLEDYYEKDDLKLNQDQTQENYMDYDISETPLPHILLLKNNL